MAVFNFLLIILKLKMSEDMQNKDNEVTLEI